MLLADTLFHDLSLAQRDREQCVVVINEESFTAHRCVIPSPPVVGPTVSPADLEAAFVVLPKHRKMNLVCFGLAAKVVQRRERSSFIERSRSPGNRLL